jgi:glycosyltransferase
MRNGEYKMIPKIIHYCWLSGDEFPDLIKKCVESWKVKLPDYEIKCWNTDNFDVNICRYTKEAFQEKKYAFVSDYVRLYALYHEGGIYLDSDIEVIKKFDDLLNNLAFTCFENNHSVAAWIFGSEVGNPIFKKFLDYYEGRAFILDNGKYDLTPNPVPITRICLEEGLLLNGEKQMLANITIYPQEYFCPYNRATEELNITENTYSIHYFNGAWINDNKKRIISKRKKIIRKYGKNVGYIYYGLALIKNEGVQQFWKELQVMKRKNR